MKEVLEVSPLEAAIILLNESFVGNHYSKEVAKALHARNWPEWYHPETWNQSNPKPYQTEDFLHASQRSQLIIDSVAQAITATLTEREQAVTRSRFGFKHGEIKTLEFIGIELGITRERVRQLERASKRKLWRPLRDLYQLDHSRNLI